MEKRYVIVGGLAAGATAAARLRRLDEYARITVFEKGPYISFANCALPYYLGGVVESQDSLASHSPESFKDLYDIDVKVNTEVINIDRHEKRVEVRDLNTGKKYKHKYDKLILTPGAVPEKPKIDGLDGEKIFTLRSLIDTVSITEYIKNNIVKRAVIIGGGYIGLEFAENISKRGINTFVVEMSDHVLPAFDYDMSQFAAMALEDNGVHLMTGTAAKSFEETESGIHVSLSDGNTLCADIVIVVTGVRPEIELAKKAGLGIGITGGVIVDEHQQTTDKDIYAAGDAIEVELLSGVKSIVPLASPAIRQGRIAADNICGLGTKYKKSLGVTVLKLFDTTLACAGLTEQQLKEREIKYETVFTQSSSRADYYPGASPITIKMIFDKKSGKIFGVQIAGREGVDKRIDVIATAMRTGMTADRLADIELAYSPMFGSVKDAVNMAGYVASNIMSGFTETVQWHEIDSIKNAFFIDVRSKEEYTAGTIKDSINIPIEELRVRLDELPLNKDIIVVCAIGQRAYMAERILRQRGYSAKTLSGGYMLHKIFSKNKGSI